MPTTLYIDCEFNSFGGDLISMALVPADAALTPFYEVLRYSHLDIDPWVQENVLPKLDQAPVNSVAFQGRLQHYLAQFPEVHIVADWPEDIAWLCRMLITGPGTRLRYPGKFTMECRPVDTVSTNPHNALADAQALRDYFAP